jgi:hypothetical protein
LKWGRIYVAVSCCENSDIGKADMDLIDIRGKHFCTRQLYLFEGFHTSVLGMSTGDNSVTLSFHMGVNDDMEVMLELRFVFDQGTDFTT